MSAYFPSLQANLSHAKAYGEKQWETAKGQYQVVSVKAKAKFAEAKEYVKEHPDTVKKAALVFGMVISAYVATFPTACGVVLGLSFSLTYKDLSKKITQIFEKQDDLGRAVLGVSIVSMVFSALLKFNTFTVLPFYAGYYFGSQLGIMRQDELYANDDVAKLNNEQLLVVEAAPQQSQVQVVDQKPANDQQ